jgi:hypothetical protein
MKQDTLTAESTVADLIEAFEEIHERYTIATNREDLATLILARSARRTEERLKALEPCAGLARGEHLFKGARCDGCGAPNPRRGLDGDG